MTQTAESLKQIICTGNMEPIYEIVEITSKVFEISVKAILGNSRRQSKVDARRAAMYLCRQEGHTYTAIGEAMNRDHTTVIDAVKAVQKEVDENERTLFGTGGVASTHGILPLWAMAGRRMP